MLKSNDPQTPDIRELQLQVNQLGVTMGNLQDYADRINSNVYSLLNTRATTPAAPAANQLWNGEMGHSVNTWNDSAYTTDDKSKECAFWFSHMKPATARNFADADVNTGTDLVAITGHGFLTGQTVDLITTGTLPAGLALLTTYFLYCPDANHIGFAATDSNAFAGTLVDITAAAGGGTHTVQEKLISVDAQTSSVNKELKHFDHSTYLYRYSRWNSQNGYAEMNGNTSVDQIMPSNTIDATTPFVRISLIAAKKNDFIEIPGSCQMAAGIFDNTSGQRKFLEGSIAFTAVLNGTPAATVERRYRALLTSDQGYQLLSGEVTIANAPKDGFFTSTCNISLSWQEQAGQLQVDLYEYLPSGPTGSGPATYRLIAQVSSASSYIHEGDFLPISVSGYPTPTGTNRSGTFFTPIGDLPNLATDGGNWDTVGFPEGIPSNYNKGLTTDRQWVRVWLTEALNLVISGVTTDGTATIVIPAGAVNSAALASGGYGSGGSSGYVGLTVEVYDSNEVLVGTLTVSSVTDDTHLVLSGTVAAGSNRIIRIVGGGFHGIFIDKVHLGFQRNTSYAPNPLDARTLQPLAAPSSSTQGGVGTGGGDTGGGIDTCVAEGTPLKLAGDTWKQVELCRERREMLSGGGIQLNVLVRLKPGFGWVRRVTAANGVWVDCTDTERFTVSIGDNYGVPLHRLREGDTVVTEIDGRTELTTIATITPYLRQCIVYTPTLSDTHLFIAGQLKLSRGKRLWRWIHGLGGLTPKGGFVLHNRKIDLGAT